MEGMVGVRWREVGDKSSQIETSDDYDTQIQVTGRIVLPV